METINIKCSDCGIIANIEELNLFALLKNKCLCGGNYAIY